MRKPWFGVVVTIALVIFSAWAYPRLPEQVATHFNIRGEPDDYSSRLFAAAFFPALLLGLTIVFRVLPRIDPRRASYVKFTDAYWMIANTIILFLAAVHILVLLYALGVPLGINRIIFIGVGLLFIVIGNYLGRIQSNWFIGIRTPWTLSSDTVWRKTHMTARWLFVIGGLAFMALAFAPLGATWPILGAVILLVALVPIVQSYVLWRAEEQAGGSHETARPESGPEEPT